LIRKDFTEEEKFLEGILKKRVLLQDCVRLPLPQLPYRFPAAILLIRSPIFV
jgi:hypothetical protein